MSFRKMISGMQSGAEKRLHRAPPVLYRRGRAAEKRQAAHITFILPHQAEFSGADSGFVLADSREPFWPREALHRKPPAKRRQRSRHACIRAELRYLLPTTEES
jgi:hypothetical protein